MCAPITQLLRKGTTHVPLQMTALALVATGALTITTMSIPASYAIDVDHGEVSQGTDAADDAQQTFIVQLEDGAADLEGVRERLGQAVAAATPGATIEYVRDYHHVFEGFALKAPRSALKAIKGVRGVAAAFAEARASRSVSGIPVGR